VPIGNRVAPLTSAQPFSFASAAIAIRHEPLLRINGYSDQQKTPALVGEAAQRMATRAAALCEPAISYRLLAIEDLAENALKLETGAVLESAGFRTEMADCFAVIVTVLTIGARFDEEARALAANRNGLDLLFLETAGWLGVEDLTRQFVLRLRDWANGEGHRLTRRFAPGYDTWPLTGQRSLVALLDGSPLPVRLLESCAMAPTMSRSAMYGVRRKADQQLRPHSESSLKAKLL
jgi:hypothetical protein